MIEVKNLTKKYGNFKAVKNASFTINDGEVVGFLGPNGAGKSTTMNIITGYLSATEGTVSVNGYDIFEQPEDAKRHIGYLPEQPPLFTGMTVDEYLNFVYDLKKTKLPRNPHLAEIRKLVKIEDVKNRLIRNLSKGYRQRVGIAQALIGNPDVLILDEPTVGLDPSQIIEIRELIHKLGKNHTVILSSHILSEIQAVCKRIIIINQGIIIADDTPENLSARLSDSFVVRLSVIGPAREVLEKLSAIPEIGKITVTGTAGEATDFKIEPERNGDICPDISKEMLAGGWAITQLYSDTLSLEDIFLKMINEPPESLLKAFDKGDRKAKAAAADDDAADGTQSDTGQRRRQKRRRKGGRQIMNAIFKREFKAYFTSPIGFAVLAIFYVISGLLFAVFFEAGQPDISGIFSPGLFLCSLIIIPILTMRLFSEERHQKADQLVMTAPVKITSVVLGKFFAAFAVYAIAVSITLVYQIIITFYIATDWMVFLGNFIGTLVFGAALIAMGMFLSTLTEVQVVVAVATYALELGLVLIPSFIVSFLSSSENAFTKVIVKLFEGMSILDRFSNFTKGTLNYSDIFFFLSLAALFLFFCITAIDRRRYA